MAASMRWISARATITWIANGSATRIKHRWAPATGDKHAYEPEDITASATDAVQVWRQFCAEARIRHLGELQVPPPGQEVLFASGPHG